jgi:hypothetical protein
VRNRSATTRLWTGTENPGRREEGLSPLDSVVRPPRFERGTFRSGVPFQRRNLPTRSDKSLNRRGLTAPAFRALRARSAPVHGQKADKVGEPGNSQVRRFRAVAGAVSLKPRSATISLWVKRRSRILITP